MGALTGRPGEGVRCSRHKTRKRGITTLNGNARTRQHATSDTKRGLQRTLTHTRRHPPTPMHGEERLREGSAQRAPARTIKRKRQTHSTFTYGNNGANNSGVCPCHVVVAAAGINVQHPSRGQRRASNPRGADTCDRRTVTVRAECAARTNSVGSAFCRRNTCSPTLAATHNTDRRGAPHPRMVTCELSRVCWSKRSQHNMQHMQITRRREKACQEPKRL